MHSWLLFRALQDGEYEGRCKQAGFNHYSPVKPQLNLVIHDAHYDDAIISNVHGAFKADSNLVWSTAGEVIGVQDRYLSRVYEPDEPVLSWEQ